MSDAGQRRLRPRRDQIIHVRPAKVGEQWKCRAAGLSHPWRSMDLSRAAMLRPMRNCGRSRAR
jgi:hypothetical protein